MTNNVTYNNLSILDKVSGCSLENYMKKFFVILILSLCLGQGHTQDEAGTPISIEDKAISDIGLKTILEMDEVDSVAVPIVSQSNMYVVQISQLHLGIEEGTPILLEHTAKTQEAIARILNKIKRAHTNIRVCPENIYDVKDFFRMYDDEADDIARFRVSVHSSSKVGSLEVMKTLSEWQSWSSARFIASYAQKMHLFGAAVVAESRVITEPNLLIGLKKINPLGSKVWFLGGGEKYLYAKGILKNENFRACENRKHASKKNIELIFGKGYASDDQIIKVLEDRDDSVVEKAVKLIESEPDKPRFIIMIMGALHDLTENIQNYNLKTGKSLGYIHITPTNLPEALERVLPN